MPFPKINPGESQDEFVQRCMADDTMTQEYPNEQQRLAICYLQGKNGKKTGTKQECPEKHRNT
jgi:hypothetical protein